MEEAKKVKLTPCTQYIRVGYDSDGALLDFDPSVKEGMSWLNVERFETDYCKSTADGSRVDRKRLRSAGKSGPTEGLSTTIQYDGARNESDAQQVGHTTNGRAPT